MTALEGRHLLRRYTEHLGSRGGVDIQSGTKCLLHQRVLRHMGQNAEFNLTVIRVYQKPARTRNKHLPNFAAQFRAHWNIL